LQTYTKAVNKEFSRDAIKSRFIETAALLHGYEHFELESFDPLVDLLFSALSKELEKSHIFLEDSYKRLLNNLTNKILPNYYLDHSPAFSVLKIFPEETFTIDKDNFSAVTEKKIDGEEKEIGFVPIQNVLCEAVDVALLADGQHIIQFENLERQIICNAPSNDNAIYLGLKTHVKTKALHKLQLYIDWINDPNCHTYSKILSNSKWTLNGKALHLNMGLNFTTQAADPFNDIIFNKHIAEKTKYIISQLEDKYFNLEFEENLIHHIGNVPKFIKEQIASQAELSFANQLVWIKIDLLNIPATRELKKFIYPTCNAIPVYNLNLKHAVERIKDPFKVVRISEEDFFIDILKISNDDDAFYANSSHLEMVKDDNKIGSYTIERQGILRTNHKMARTSIRKLIDLIKEERNAYATFNPEWIIDELHGIQSHIKRIHHKLGEDLTVADSDVFLIFESEKKNDLVKIEYWSTNGNNGNNIPPGKILETNCEKLLNRQEAIVLVKSQSGTSDINEEKKKNEMLSLLHSRNQLTTTEDYKLAIKNLISPLEVLSIDSKKTLKKTFGNQNGFSESIQFKIHTKADPEYNEAQSHLQNRIKTYLNKHGIMNIDVEPIIIWHEE